MRVFSPPITTSVMLRSPTSGTGTITDRGMRRAPVPFVRLSMMFSSMSLAHGLEGSVLRTLLSRLMNLLSSQLIASDCVASDRITCAHAHTRSMKNRLNHILGILSFLRRRQGRAGRGQVLIKSVGGC